MRLAWPLATALAATALTPPAFAVEPGLTLPTYTPAYEPTTVDERGIWMDADEDERAVRDSPLRIKGPLETYIRDILCREVGSDRCQGVRLYVLEVPNFNAFMMANGCMVVQTGLLLRARSEAELAAVLGHEFGHFELRHGLGKLRSARSTSDVMAWIGVLGAVTNTSTSDVQFSLAASYHSFTRAQETEADLIGMQYMASSGYPSLAASQVWRQLMAEADAQAISRGRKPRQSYTANAFASHPANLKRALYLADAAKKTPGGNDDRAKEYRAAIAPYLPRFLTAQIRLNDFGASDFVINAIAAGSGWTGDLLFARAELYRGRGNPRDLQMAIGWYREAKAAGYAAPDLDRDLGLALLRNGQTDDARQALTAYLAAKPDASDAKMIQMLVSN